MARVTKCFLVLFVLAFTTFSYAGSEPITVCNEQPTAACIQSLTLTSPNGTVQFASEGGMPAMFYGAKYVTSDGIKLGNPGDGSAWLPDNRKGAFNNGLWTPLGNQTWVLPETAPEAGIVGVWYLPGHLWNTGPNGDVGEYDAAEEGFALCFQNTPGSCSDRIILDNNGLDGSAEIIFMSDPEPATLLVLIPGLLGAGYGLRRKLLI